MKYTDEAIAQAVADSLSMRETLRRLGIRNDGGSLRNIKSRIARAGINTGHWTGGTANHEPSRRNGWPRRTADEILVLRTSGRRERAHLLRRALFDIGREYLCKKCGCGPEWNGRPLTLDVDHVDGNWLDDRAHNLRFLCPNCHSQEETSRPCPRGLTAEDATLSRSRSGFDTRRGFQCATCGQPKKSAIGAQCRSCGNRRPGRTKIDWPPVDELRRRVSDSSVVAVARELGVSDVAVHKRLKKAA